MAIRKGKAGSDLLDANALGEADRLNEYFGLAGDDTLTGGALTDRLVGGSGGDVLLGGDGADTLVDQDETGNDRLDGGTGDDTIIGRFGTDTLLGGAGHDTIHFGLGSMLIDGGQGDDIFISFGKGPGTATISGGAGDDVLTAGASADGFDGGQGEDLVDYSTTRKAIAVDFRTGFSGGGAAGDSFRSVEDIIGTAYSDTLIGNGVTNVLVGGSGDDTIGGGLGGDFLDGGDGFDIADLGAGGSSRVIADLAVGSFTGGGSDGDTLLNFEGLAGGDLADILAGDAGANTLLGRGGDDTLTGADGNDTMIGGIGSDVYRVGSLGDVIVEGVSAGTDRVEATIDYSLASLSNVENLVLVGALNGTGNALANAITGNDLDNVLDGGRGADTLIGGLGNDTYVIDSRSDRIMDAGGAFDQILTSITLDIGQQVSPTFPSQIERVIITGEADIDFLSRFNFTGEVIGNSGDNRFVMRGDASFTGGAGDDKFFFSQLDAVATVTDYIRGEDTLQLYGAGFKLSPGALDEGSFRQGRFAVDPSDRVLYYEPLGELYIDRDGSGSRYSPQIVGMFEGGLKLAASDFLVV